LSFDKPAFFIGRVGIPGNVIFAPMAGFADVPTRRICTMFGSSMQYTEFVAVEEILKGGSELSPLLDYEEDEYPVVFQLFGNDARKFLEAAKRIEVLGPDIIDINMGCSTRRVSGRGAGVGMMPNIELIEETFRLLTRNLKTPVTAKIRLGWNVHQNYLEVGRLLEDCGVAAIAIHPRTKEQKYTEKANWEAITELKHAVNIPIIGNGDVSQPRDIDLMRQLTGCDAVMVGRGALGNPWLLAGIEKNTIRVRELVDVIRKHHQLMIGYYGPRGHILFRKHIKRYLDGLGLLSTQTRKLVGTETVDQFNRILAELDSLFGEQSVGDLVDIEPLKGQKISPDGTSIPIQHSLNS
jgi:tRNA-dihydrouridine synthase B